MSGDARERAYLFRERREPFRDINNTTHSRIPQRDELKRHATIDSRTCRKINPNYGERDFHRWHSRL